MHLRATVGPLANLNQQQDKIFGSFGTTMGNIRTALAKMGGAAGGVAPAIDGEPALVDFERGLARLERRQVFGKVIVEFEGGG